jgi:hypothetical protein
VKARYVAWVNEMKLESNVPNVITFFEDVPNIWITAISNAFIKEQLRGGWMHLSLLVAQTEHKLHLACSQRKSPC